jgi:hypothetical protein
MNRNNIKKISKEMFYFFEKPEMCPERLFILQYEKFQQYTYYNASLYFKHSLQTLNTSLVTPQTLSTCQQTTLNMKLAQVSRAEVKEVLTRGLSFLIRTDSKYTQA